MSFCMYVCNYVTMYVTVRFFQLYEILKIGQVKKIETNPD